jgi:lysine 2,3-aminomutase
MSQKFLTSIDEPDSRFDLSPGEPDRPEEVCGKFPFRASEYNLSLIEQENRKSDPLHRIVIPDPRELKGGGSLDPFAEKDNTKRPGLRHKYARTGLLF